MWITLVASATLGSSGCGAAWLARLLGVQEVPGSNPGSPTKYLIDFITSRRYANHGGPPVTSGADPSLAALADVFSAMAQRAALCAQHNRLIMFERRNAVQND